MVAVPAHATVSSPKNTKSDGVFFFATVIVNAVL
jgi:hypothetical protein